MKWQEEGIILSVRQQGENSVVVSLLTRSHGRHGGLVRVSSKSRPVIQPGNYVQASWSARLPEHLGTYQLELIQSPIARIMADSLRLTAMTSLLNTLDRLLAERDLYPSIYDMTYDLMQQLATEVGPVWLKAYASFEIKILEILGYGLDFSQCAATGQQTDLAFVSPKSGRAVSREAGLPYADRLLEIPQFIFTESETLLPVTEIKKALQLSGYFLAKYFFNGIMPNYRARLGEALNSTSD